MDILIKNKKHSRSLECFCNFYAFKNFHMNLTYPKKIVDSSIKNEHLPGRPNFRYKKVNIFLGANATGKTTFGKILMKIFNFIEKKNFEINLCFGNCFFSCWLYEALLHGGCQSTTSNNF